MVFVGNNANQQYLPERREFGIRRFRLQCRGISGTISDFGIDGRSE